MAPLKKALSLFRRNPILFGPELLVTLGAAGLMALVMRFLFFGLEPVNFSLYGGVAFLVAVPSLFIAPGFVSGLLTANREVSQKGRATWADFFAGLGTYYWRVVGGAIILGLVAGILGGLLGAPRRETLFFQTAEGSSLFMAILRSQATPGLLLSAVVDCFLVIAAFLWYPAVALDNEKALSAIGRALEVFRQKPGLFLTLGLLYWLLNELSGLLGLFALGLQNVPYTFFPLDRGRFSGSPFWPLPTGLFHRLILFSVIFGAIAVLLKAYFRLAFFLGYQEAKTQ